MLDHAAHAVTVQRMHDRAASNDCQVPRFTPKAQQQHVARLSDIDARHPAIALCLQHVAGRLPAVCRDAWAMLIGPRLRHKPAGQRNAEHEAHAINP